MEYKIYTQFSAATYNCGAYGAGAYNETSCATVSGSDNGSTSGDGGLANTGTDFFLFLALGIALVLGSALYLYKSVRKAKSHKA